MSLHGLALFCLVYLVAAASPGPGVAAVVGRVIGRGRAGMAAFIAGFVIGDLIWFMLAATGMAALAESAHVVFMGVKFAGVAYLAYLAYRFWNAPVQSLDGGAALSATEGSLQIFLGGLSLTMGNPKVMVFFLALLPTVVDLAKLTAADFLEVALAMCIILTAVLSGYAFLAHRTRRLFGNTGAVRWLNRGAGTVMAGAAVAIATR